MTPTMRKLVPILLTAALALHGCGDKDDSAGSASEPEGTNPGECSDGADNDSDGAYDCDDSDCAGAPECESESDTDTGETDPVDADGDGVPADEDCDDTDPTLPAADDADCDGFTVAEGDCDPDDVSIHPFAGDTYGDGIDSDCDGLDCEASLNGDRYLTVCSDSGALKTWADSFDSCTAAGYGGLATLDDPGDQEFLYGMNGIVPSCNIWVDPTNQGTSSATTGCFEINHSDGLLDTTNFCGPTWSNCQYACKAVLVDLDDGDGDGVTVSEGDCDDTDASIYPFAGDTYGDGVDSDCDGLDCEAAFNGSRYLALCSDSGALKTWADSFDSCTAAGYGGLATLDDPSDQEFLYGMNGIVPSCNIWVDPTNQGTSSATTGCFEINHSDGLLDTTNFCGPTWSNCQYACQ